MKLKGNETQKQNLRLIRFRDIKFKRNQNQDQPDLRIIKFRNTTLKKKQT